jgi:hypothetical protein
MGAILAQQSPLYIVDIEGLIDLRNPITHNLADVEHFVHRLRTVLVAGAGEINSRTFPRVHRLFSDFVTSAGAEDFRVDTIDSNGELAIRCIRQLTRLWAGARQGLQEIPAQLPYVTENWASHLTRVVGAKVDEAQRDDESISIADGIDVLTWSRTWIQILVLKSVRSRRRNPPAPTPCGASLFLRTEGAWRLREKSLFGCEILMGK